VDDLKRWSADQPGTTGYAWWEIAAGGVSSIAILALLAAAADPELHDRDAHALATAYWPHVCVVSTMLDSLVDYERDMETGDFSYVSWYPERSAARQGLVDAATHSLTAARSLRHRRIHLMIVCGVAGYYAAIATRGSLAAEVSPHVLAALRPAATPIVLVLRAHHRLASLRA
jgi:tetraprenyl-beta-curcumene synthase